MRRLLPTLLLVAACGDGPADRLEGSWVLVRDEQGLGQQLRFDGELAEVTMQIEGRPKVREYLYKVLEATEERIVMDWVDGNGEHVDVAAEFRGAELLLRFSGEEFLFRRG